MIYYGHKSISGPKLIIYIRFQNIFQSFIGVEATHPAGAIETFSIFSRSFGPNVYISGTFSMYLRPNVYIYVQMSILMSNEGGFLEVIMVLQTVGAQIRPVRPRKWSGCWNFSIISVI